jgi:hypothetical protein
MAIMLISGQHISNRPSNLHTCGGFQAVVSYVEVQPTDPTLETIAPSPLPDSSDPTPTSLFLEVV